MAKIKLSICIATYGRGQFIGETLSSIISQIEPEVELVIVDGASPDNTHEIVAEHQKYYPALRYYRESENSGVDRDFDKAVVYANGEYCWLMTDDDLMMPGAIRQILSSINDGHDLIVANSEVRTVDFSKVLKPRLLDISSDKEFGAETADKFFNEVANCLSFIGSVIIRRQVWLDRDRSSYFGTLFVHVGVIFQHPPIVNVKCIANPLVVIRYGNAMWTSRGFEIWMFKWPNLIWSFNDFSSRTKALVCPPPWANIKRIVLFRAVGGYSMTEYRRFLSSTESEVSRILLVLIAVFPAVLMNFLAGIYCALFNHSDRLAIYDLSHSKHASWPTRLAARILGV
mgnify:CR=1 FL=1